MNKLSNYCKSFTRHLWRAALYGSLLSFSAASFATVPAVNDARLTRLAERIAAASENPRRYAVPMEFDGSEMLAAGTWQVSGAKAIWRLPISSADAVNVSVGFSELSLPASSEIWLSGGGISQGPYSLVRPSQLIALVPGGDAELTIVVPAGAQDNVSFSSLTLFHGFRGPGLRANNRAGEPSGEPTTRAASSCLQDNDVVCPVGDPWEDETRAVARITVGNVLLCTAVLLNDTSQSLTPYLLTADHCGENMGSNLAGFDALDALNTIAYWNFERSQCGGEDDGSLTQNQAGAQLRANSEDIDFALLELQSAPSAAFNVHWAGWDARGVGGSSGAGIHHPDGGEKIISLFSRSLEKARPLQSLDANDYWRVFWSDGVTEGGSSGSGLWNQDRRVVGSLSRGSSECRTATNSLNGNPETFPDFYSAFDAAWVGNGTSSGQLSAWLDSANNGLMVVNGRDASAPSQPVGGGNAGGGDGGDDSPPSGDSGESPSSSGGGGGGGGGAVLVLIPVLLLTRYGLGRYRHSLK